MTRLHTLTRPLLWLTLASGALLTACGGGDGSTPPASDTPDALSGTAAVGLPIVGGTVNVRCAGGAALDTTTSSSGAWSVTLSGQTLPCAVQVSAGTVGGASNTNAYHAIALTVGTVNVTPLTDLVVARILGSSPQAWFDAPVFTAFSSSAVTSALDAIRTALGLAAALGSADPFTTAFAANGSDTLDKVLDALQDALDNAETSYAALLAAAQANDFAGFSGFPAAFEAAWSALNSSGSGGGGGGGGGGGSGGGGGGGTLPGGITLSKVVGGLDSLGNSVAVSEASTNTTTNVTTHVHNWGDGLSSMKLVVSHAITPSGFFGAYELLFVNLARYTPTLSAQLDTSAGACVLQATNPTILANYPLCTSLGIQYDREAGTVSFDTTLMRDMVGGNGNFTITGTMGFSAY